MSDTPETDAALYPMNGVDIVWPEFARQLERERDEAITRRMETIMQCELYEQERDEVMAALEYIAYSGRSALHIEDYAKEFLSKK